MKKVKFTFSLIAFIFIFGSSFSQSWTYYQSEKRPSAVLIDSLNNKWIAYAEGLKMYDDSLWTEYKQPLLFVKKALYQDGKIWIVNGNGDILDFDGNTWTEHVIGGFYSKNVSDMVLSQNGDLWIGTRDNGLYVYYGNTFGVPNSIANSFNKVYALAIDANDSIEISCENGLMKMDNQAQGLHSIQPDSIKTQINSILINGNKKYYTTNKKLYYYNDTILQVFNSSDTALTYATVANLQMSANGSVWMNSNRYLYEFDTLTNFNHKQFYSTVSNLYDFSVDTNNVPWVVGRKGVFTFANNQTTSYSVRESGLDYYGVRDIEFDKYGSAWILTAEKLVKYGGNEWTTVSDSLGYYSYNQNCLAIGPNAEKWIGTDNVLLRIDSSGTINTYATNYLANSHINDIEIDQLNKVWIATEGGVSVFNGSSFINYTVQDGLPDNTIYDIFIDQTGKLWVGTKKGVASFNGSSWDTLNSTTIQLKNIKAIAQDNQGNMWFGTNSSYANYIYKYDGSLWSTYSSTSSINSIYCDPSGVNYFATNNEFLVYKNNAWIKYKHINGLLFSVPYSLSKSPTGSLWIGCYNGISVFDPGPVSINPSLLNNKIVSVYPNPCSDILSIQTIEPDLKTVELFDLNGKSIIKKTCRESQINLNVSTFSRGIYLLKVQTDNSCQTQKVIIY